MGFFDKVSTTTQGKDALYRKSTLKARVKVKEKRKVEKEIEDVEEE